MNKPTLTGPAYSFIQEGSELIPDIILVPV